MKILPEIFPQIREFIESVSSNKPILSEDRKAKLLQIASFAKKQIDHNRPVQLIFICTHNSRRSHFGQIWAKVLADYYGLPEVSTYSGGTEATAFNPNAIQALRTVGFRINEIIPGENPHYEVHYSESLPPQKAWSKVYDDPFNPTTDFCAVMTCSEADEACPIVFGAEERVSLPFEDPKKSDGTPEQAATYLARCEQIAAELAFVFQSIEQ